MALEGEDPELLATLRAYPKTGAERLRGVEDRDAVAVADREVPFDVVAKPRPPS
jgi:hypothetical protein